MQFNKYIFFGFFQLAVASFGTTTLAQQRTDSTIKTQNIDIYQRYKPEVSKATKPKITPTLPGVDTVQTIFNYTVPEQTLNYSYKSIPITPLAMGIEEHALPFDSYVALGLGNLNTILVDAGIAKLQTDKLSTTIHGKHLSQKGGGIATRQNARTEIDANGSYSITEDLQLIGNIGFNRVGVTQYGGLGDTLTSQSHIDSLKQIYTSVFGNIGIANKELYNGLTYAPSVGFKIYGDKRDATEQSFYFNAPFSYVLDTSLRFGLDINGSFSKFRNVDTNLWNNAFYVSPYVNFTNEFINITAGITPTWGGTGDFYWLPNLKFKTILGSNAVTLHGGWTGELVRNTFEELSTMNPFMHNFYLPKQTKSQRVFGGLDLNLGKHMVVGGTIAWNQWNHFAQFVNDYGHTSDGRAFNVIYDDKVQSISFDAHFKYQIAEYISFVGSGTWNNFTYKEMYDKVFHHPKVQLNAAINIAPIKKLNLTGSFHFWDGMYRLNLDQSINKIPAFADVSIKGNYSIIPRLSVFLQLNNLLNQQYARWNQYHVYGINVIGGLRFKF